MIAQYMQEKGEKKGRRDGILEGEVSLLTKMVTKKYQLEPNKFSGLLKNLKVEQFEDLGEKIVDCDEWERILEWIKKLS